MSNTDLAKQIAQLADALAQYDHLPALDTVEWKSDGTAHFQVPNDNLLKQLRDMSTWASAFGADVKVARFSSGTSLEVSFEFQVDGTPATMGDYLYGDNTEAVLSALDGPTTGCVLSPDQFG